MKSILATMNLSSPHHCRPLKVVHLCVSLIAALLCGCISPEGDVRTATLTTEEPFQSLRCKRVTLLRPIHIRERPNYVSDKFSSDRSSDDVAWVDGANEDVEKLLVGRTLPAGTVIRLQGFSLVRSYNLAWLPGQGTGLPWYPGRGLLPNPTSFYAKFTSETTSAIGRPLGEEIVLGYRWGSGSHLWVAPWEPKGKEPVFVGELGRSFKPSH